MFGTAIAFPVLGLILDKYGWKVTNKQTLVNHISITFFQISFYASGCLGIVWCLICLLLVTDDPENNCWLSLSEKKAILEKRTSFKDFKDDRRGILTQMMKILSIPTVWLCALDDFASSISLNMVVVEGPTFIKEYLGKDITQVSYLPCFAIALNFFAIAIPNFRLECSMPCLQ